MIKLIQTFKPVKKIYIPPELPNKHFNNVDTENQEMKKKPQSMMETKMKMKKLTKQQK